MDRIWVIGGNGQIGTALVRLLGDRAIAPSVEELDLSFPERIDSCFDQLEAQAGRPAAIINAAAYTLVEQAEHEESLARRINADAPGAMASWCRPRGVPFLHYSTDYVYAGTGTSPWREDDATGPLNAYGRTKLEGDRRIEESGVRHLIFRTSWVYDSRGRNFFNTMLRLGREGETVRVVGDQVGAPSYAPHLASATLTAMSHALRMDAFPSGTYHMAHEGDVSWHGFAQEIFAAARRRGLNLKVERVEAVATADYPTVARRPLNSKLDKAKLRRVFGFQLPTWRDGLDACLDEWMAANLSCSSQET